MNTLKILLFSIFINIILIFLFVEFVTIPINNASKAIAEHLCNNPELHCTKQ